MHFFKYLSALLIFAISAAGLPLQRQCGGTFLCGSITNMPQESLVSDTASDDTVASKEIKNPAPTALIPVREVFYSPMTINGKAGWICPGGKIRTRNLDNIETRNTATNSTAIKNTTVDVTTVNIVAVNSTAANNTEYQRGPPVAVPAGWWCGTIICFAKMEPAKKRQTDITVSDASVPA